MPRASRTTQGKGKKRPSKAEREAIKAAAAAIPELLAEERPKKQRPRTVDYHSPHYQKKQRLLWIGVIALMTGIALLWVFSVQQGFSALSRSGGIERAIYEDAKAEFAAISAEFEEIEEQIERDAGIFKEQLEEATTSPPEDPEALQKTIKNELSDLVSLLKTTSTAASSTPTTSTSPFVTTTES